MLLLLSGIGPRRIWSSKRTTTTWRSSSMPDILYRTANVAALSTTRPLEGGGGGPQWKFRRCPYPRGLYTILVRSDGAAGGAQHAVFIGTTEVVQRSDTSAGGT